MIFETLRAIYKYCKAILVTKVFSKLFILFVLRKMRYRGASAMTNAGNCSNGI